MERVSINQFASNAIWKFIEFVSRKFITLLISVLLARLIAPAAFGIIALTTVFIAFSNVFILNGFNIAIIRKGQVTDADYSTVTCLSISFSCILYIIFFFASPNIASFFNTPELSPVLRVITTLLFFQSIATVIRAKGIREFAFKKMSISTFIGSILAGIIGVFLAYLGYGVWALVAQQVLANLFDMVIMMIIFKWHLSFRFSWAIAKQLIKFSFGVIGASFLDFFGNNFYNLAIGKAYSQADLGYYNRGSLFPETISLNTYNAINSVLLPTLASRQHDTMSMKRVVRKVMSLTMYIIFPLMLGLIAISDRLIPVLLTDKWNPCIPLMIFSCIYYGVNPVRAIGNTVFYGRGESQRGFKIEIIRTSIMVINLIVIVILLKKNLYLLAATNAFISILIAVITQYQVKRCINYTHKELLSDIIPGLWMSIVMLILTRLIGLIKIASSFTLLIIQIIFAIATYITLSYLLKDKNFIQLYGYIKLVLMNKILNPKKILEDNS